jgi:phosphoglycerol transferase MdoB-like AlkP superfamily enzyme
MNRAYLIEKIWYESYVPVFLEKFVLPVLAASVVAVIVINPLKWDWRQRIALFMGVLFLAYFVAYTLYRSTPKETPTPVTVETPKTGNATTSGANSPANTGNGNNFNNDQPPPPKQ